MFLSCGIFSELLDDKGNFFCSIGEHAYEQPDGTFKPRLPSGIYTCQKGAHSLSDLVPFITFQIMNVPDHTGVLFHQGNYPQTDSHMCLLTGTGIGFTSNGERMIVNSKIALKKLMELHKYNDSFLLDVD